MTWLYLRATRANGNVHASLCEVGLGYAPEFRRVMEVQGLTVTEYDEAGYRALCGQAVASQTQVPPRTEPDPVPAPEATSQPAALAPAPPPEATPPGLPPVGLEIKTRALGRCTVSYTVRYPGGEEVAVAVGPLGATTVRAGEWTPWTVTSPAHQPEPEQSHDAPPAPEAAPVSPTPKPTHMPDLFGNWS